MSAWAHCGGAQPQTTLGPDWQAQAMRSPAAATSTAAAPGDPNDNPVNRLFVVQQEAMSLRRHVKELQAAHEASRAPLRRWCGCEPRTDSNGGKAQLCVPCPE